MADDDVTAVFRANLVRLLRDVLGQVPAGTRIEDLLADASVMERLAQAILSAPLAADQRPLLTVVPDPELAQPTDLYDVARQATDNVFGLGTYADLNKHHPDPGVQRAIRRSKAQDDGGSDA